MSLPSWIKIKDFNRPAYLETLNTINKGSLNTVCVSGDCPNRYECFSEKTATFMILGNTCTRNCLYCNIKSGKGEDVDSSEPTRIAQTINKLGLKFAVITSVTRDDLADGGSGQFAQVIREIKKLNNGCRIEVLIPDFKGSAESLVKVLDAGPDVLNHNIETVEKNFSRLRPKASYRESLLLIKRVKISNPEIKTKSGIMIGLGEDEESLLKTFKDLKESNCDILTIGQFLRPDSRCEKVQKYYTPEEFEDLKRQALQIGIKEVISGPLVRSSYKASKYV